MRKFFYLSLLSWVALRSGAALAEDRVWEKLQLPEAARGRNLHSVHFADAKHGWIVGDKGLCLATRDGGTNWQIQKTGSAAILRGVQFLNAQTGWICGDGDPKAPRQRDDDKSKNSARSSTVLHTVDSGKTWETFWVKAGNFPITSIEASNAPLLHIGLSGGDLHPDGYFLHSLDGGKTWKGDLNSKVFRGISAVRAVGGKRLVAVGSAFVCEIGPAALFERVELYHDKLSRALYSEDGGKTWKASKGSEGSQRAYLGVSFEKGTLKVSRVGGIAEKAGIQRGDVVVKLGGDKVASFNEFAKCLKRHKPGERVSVVVQRVDHSMTLTAQLEGHVEGAFLRALAVGKGRAVLAVGDQGAILRSTDAGVSWESVTSPTTANLRGVTWCGPLALAVGEKGTVVVGEDDGKSWKHVSLEQTPTLNGVAAAGDCIIAVGKKGTALRAKAFELAKKKKTSR